MRDTCFACGTALALTGQRERGEDGALREYYICRNAACGQYKKRQGWRPATETQVAVQTEETKSARAAFVTRRLAQKKH